MNQTLKSISQAIKHIPNELNQDFHMPPHTTKTNKCIRFFKDDLSNGNNIISELTNPSEESAINLQEAIKHDLPYGNCSRTEAEECFNSKKKHMLQDDYFSSTVDKNHLIDLKKLPEYFIIKEEDAKRQINDIFETALLDPNRLDLIKQNLQDFQLGKTKGPIGPLVSCDSLIILMNVNTKAIKQSFEEMKNDIIMVRYILNDGNSFFRSFMMGLFEHHILYGNIGELRKLIIGICTKVKSKQLLRHNPSIHLHEVMIILYLIYSNVLDKKTKSAYELFFKALNLSRSFDYSLIKYMRIAIGEYIETNADIIFKSETWEEIELIAAPAYLSNHCFDYVNYINDRVLAMDFEADKFLIQIAPVVFRINLALYAIEGTANEVKHLTYLKQYYHSLEDLSTHNSITLFYSFSRYHKLYPIDFFNYHNSNIIYRQVKGSLLSKRFDIVNPDYPCDTCNKQSDLITFKHISNSPFCKNCIVDSIDKIITKRLTHFIEEYYNNKEYYFRFIALSEKFEDKLYEEDFIALFNRNIPQQILYKMEQICFQCKKTLGDKSEKMPCECKICYECLIDNIMVATNKKIIMNQYEKGNYKKKVICCPCKNDFNVDRAVELVYQAKLPQLQKEAWNRLLKTGEVTCAFCGKYHEKANLSKTVSLNTNIVKNDYLDVITFNTIKNKEHNDCLTTHIICKDCIKDLKNEIKNKIHRGELEEKTSSYPLDCKVCIVTHQIDGKILKEHRYNECCIFF